MGEGACFDTATRYRIFSSTPMETQSENIDTSSPSPGRSWFYGWIIVAICTAIVFVVTGTKGSFGALFKDMQEDMGWDRGTTAGASAISTLAWGLTLPLVGPLVDRYGAKRVMVGSIFLMIAAVVPMFWVKSLWALYLFFGVLPGAAIAGSTVVPAASLIGIWFHNRAGLASGLISSAFPLGWAVFTPITALLVPIWGWRISYIVLSASLLLILPLALFFLRDEPLAGEIPEAERSTTASPSSPAFKITLREAMGTPLFRLLLLSQVSCGFVDHVVAVHFIPFVSDTGQTEVFAAMLLSAIHLAAVAGSVTSGWMCDHYNRKSTLFMMHGLRAISLPMLILFGHTGSVAWLFLFAPLYGATVMMGFPPTSTLVVRAFGHRSVGTVYGTLQVTHQLGMAAGAYFTGLIFDLAGSYYPVFVIATGIAAFAMISMPKIKETSVSERS